MNRALPLAGVRVLDLTRLLPGPLCTSHLARLGAEVIKIEDTGAGDYASPGVRRLTNAGKRSVRIDLKNPQGLAVLHRLCATAQVLVEGFRPGVMARLGVGYGALAAINPALVYCSITGYGQDGPYKDEPGHDINYGALTGVADQVGSAAGPALSNLPLADLMGGTLTSAMGILAALFDAQRSRQGRHVDIAMADAVLAHAVMPMAELLAHGETAPTGGDVLTGRLACYGLYATQDGRHVAVGALEDKFWHTVCERLGHPEWAALHRSHDPQVQARLRADLARVFMGQPLRHWAALFEGAQACVSPVLRLSEALEHPQLVARGAALRDAQGQWQLPSAVKFGGEPRAMAGATPAAGEHTQELLTELGYAAQEIAALQDTGAVA
ncbi:CaiB/BaiF CoA transferase family protein [Hydrogenophaga sp. BPS33]|uniref:CaiB/BaiF CoA transferase family protein n=1 Tax=Hydrogenophaga sp. BPS33 TaxID=2651974 RepID=UPI00131FCBAD|nr:CaiB/BaiF CoA-transferase family protein [Hydrogenophaga sp. BPS33]QHE83935.1 CoA transferase [Hydrogenophaga sp. BPS33]